MLMELSKIDSKFMQSRASILTLTCETHRNLALINVLQAKYEYLSVVPSCSSTSPEKCSREMWHISWAHIYYEKKIKNQQICKEKVI